MNFAQWVITAVVIICAIVFLFVWHYRTWSVRKSESTNENDRRYHALQYRRRMHTTGMMGILAVMLFFGQLFTITGWSGVVYWGSAFCLTIWLIFMAFGDVTATRVQVARSRQSLLMEQAKLQREINEIRQQEANGAETNGAGAKDTGADGAVADGAGADE